MIAARSGRTDITNILLEGEHIDLDIQENVRNTIWRLYFLGLNFHKNSCYEGIH